MKEMRVLGRTIQKLAEEQSVTMEDLGRIVHCTPRQIAQLYKGRLFLGFDQLCGIAKRLNVSAADLLAGDEAYYQKNVVHCMGASSGDKAREEILDIIDDYLDLYTAVHESQPA